jgi:hypothetical protein
MMNAPLKSMLLVLGMVSVGGLVVLKNAHAGSSTLDPNYGGANDSTSITLADKKEAGAVELAEKHDGGMVVELSAKHDGGMVVELSAKHDGGMVVELSAKHDGGMVVELMEKADGGGWLGPAQ